YTDKKLDCVFSAGEDKFFPDRPMNMDLSEKEVRETAAAKAVLNKHGYVYTDLTGIPYYQKYFTRQNKKMIKSTFAYPMIVNGKVEGVISLYGYENNTFTDSLLFRIEQLNAEICKNLSNIRARRKAKEAIHQYEECLRTQIHELETNKKIMQRQAGEVNAMIGDLILARDAAEKANRTKTEFLANISHELRTPLNAILGFSEAIESETFGPIENKQYKDYIGYISTSGKHLLSLINDVLDLSCVEVGRHKMNEERIQVIPLIQDVISVITRYPGGDKRHITVTPKKSNIVLLADERSFKQILLNVLSNAIKFTQENGKIKISVGLTDKKELMITVTDNGVGIPKNKIGDLFQPFAQVENIMTREHEGSGLGLVLIRKLIELHGGRVWIESEEGKGTSVFLVFPKSRVFKDNKRKEEK
ncbi:MAG: ATP-binding protein, partial [Alphaproteobacteria bacterium]